MKRFLDKIKSIPWWGWVTGIFYFALQYGLYRLGAWLSRVLGTISYAFEWKIDAVDDLFPVVPVFAVIYLFSYVFWICAPVAVSLTKKRNFINYIVGLSLAYLLGFLFFIFLPTYMDRGKENLMAIAAAPGFFHQLLGTIYEADGSAMAFNLFPSYHCLISAYCYLGVRKQPEISRGFRIYSLVMAALICLSTVLTKQHYIVDCFGGVAISLLCYWLVNKLDPGAKLSARWQTASRA